MMKRPLFLLSMIVLVLCACQKEYTFDEQHTTTQTLNDSTALSKYILLDTTKSAGSDTTNITNFIYDNQKRNIAIEDYAYDVNGKTGDGYIYTFYYNGNDNVPYKKTLRYLTAQPSPVRNYADTSFYTYNSNNQIIKDSSISVDPNPATAIRQTFVHHYSYFGNRISENVIYIEEKPLLPVYRDTISKNVYFSTLNNNRVHQVDTTNNYIQDLSFTYDDKVNPFQRTMNKFTEDYPLFFMESTEEVNFEKNNIIETVQSFDTYHFHLKSSFQYKANGYPKTIHVIDVLDPLTFWKGVYVYTKL